MMLEIAQYVQFVEQDVFPKALNSLHNCKSVAEVSGWKKMFCKEIFTKQIKGEDAFQDLLPDYYPQEESKTDFNMPQRIFIEAHRLEDDKMLADRILQRDTLTHQLTLDKFIKQQFPELVEMEIEQCKKLIA